MTSAVPITSWKSEMTTSSASSRATSPTRSAQSSAGLSASRLFRDAGKGAGLSKDAGAGMGDEELPLPRC